MLDEREPNLHVILSEAKNLAPRAYSCPCTTISIIPAWYARDEILRSTQNDTGAGVPIL
jgi:hypothetical protein